jgi:hypothetical protein
MRIYDMYGRSFKMGVVKAFVAVLRVLLISEFVLFANDATGEYNDYF